MTWQTTTRTQHYAKIVIERDDLRKAIAKALRHLDHAPAQHRNGPIYQAADALRAALGLESAGVGGKFSFGVNDAAPETAAERDRLREINAELLEALKGDEVRDLWRIGWLDTLLSEIDGGTFGRIGEDEDPNATWEMIQNIKDLARLSRAAIARAEGEDR